MQDGIKTDGGVDWNQVIINDSWMCCFFFRVLNLFAFWDDQDWVFPMQLGNMHKSQDSKRSGSGYKIHRFVLKSQICWDLVVTCLVWYPCRTLIQVLRLQGLGRMGSISEIFGYIASLIFLRQILTTRHDWKMGWRRLPFRKQIFGKGRALGCFADGIYLHFEDVDPQKHQGGSRHNIEVLFQQITWM